MERYFYFGEPTVETTGEAAMFALSDFLGASHTSDDTMQIHFKARNGSKVDDIIEIDFSTQHVALGDSSRQVKGTMEDIALLLKHNNKNQFVSFWDGVTNTGAASRILYNGDVAITTEA